MSVRKYTAEELKAAADELERQGETLAASLARNGYPALAAMALRKSKLIWRVEKNEEGGIFLAESD